MKRLASIALATFSCATAPPVEHPDLGVEVPVTWTVEAPPTDTTAEPDGSNLAWWRGFGDRQLEAVIEEALARNRDVEVAVSRVYAAAAQARIAGAAVLPSAGVVFDGQRTRRVFIGFPFGGGGVPSSHFTTQGVALNLSWEIDLWGRIRAGKSAALGDLEAARAEAHGVHLSLAGQTAKLWFSAVEARRQVEVAEATLENFRSTHEKILSRYERGLRPSLDVRFSLTNIAAAEAAVENRREQLDRLGRQIEVLLNRYPAGRLETSEDLPEVAPAVPDSLPGELLTRRPDLVAAERRLAATGARVTEARRALYPRLSLTASGGTSSSETADLADLDFSVWSVAGNVVQPILGGGQLRGAIDLAESRQREALASYVSLALDAYREVESALAADRFLAARERALREATEQSVAARVLATDRYERGLDDIITVLEAQRRAFEAESLHLTAKRLRLDNRVDLYLALGGDFHWFQREEPTTGGSREEVVP